MSKVFRKIALERLSSPEQLDKLVTVTTPSGWFALLGLGLVLLVALFWSVNGKIPTTVMGGGILIKTGGVVSVVAPVEGQLDAIYVREGEHVRKGQIIARIAQPGLLDEIRAARLALDEELQRERLLADVGDEKYRLSMAGVSKDRENLKLALHALKDRIGHLMQKVEVQGELSKEGLITRQTLNNTRVEYDDVILQQAQKQAELKKLEEREQELGSQREQQLNSSHQLVGVARRELELKEARLAFSSRVICGHTGVVVELRASQGSVINPGQQLLNLEQSGDAIQDLQALIYMTPEKGKQIKPGMVMRITPQTVKREEFGYMLGIVTNVTEFPSSEEGMMRHLKNEGLVRQFTEEGAPIAISADLIPDPKTTSGFKWSSPKGPPLRVFSGTLCSGSVEVRTQPPISLMIPYLKKNMGLD